MSVLSHNISDDEVRELVKYILTVWHLESSSSYIQPLDVKKIYQASRILEEKIQNLNNLGELEKEIIISEVKILKKILLDIARLRLNKLLSGLLYETELPLENLLPFEKSFYIKIRALISDFFKNFSKDQIITEDLNALRSDIPSEYIPKTDLEYSIAIAYNDIKAFVGVDGLIYRGIREGDVLSLPIENLRAFKKLRLRPLSFLTKTVPSQET